MADRPRKFRPRCASIAWSRNSWVQPAHDELRDAFLDAIAAARHEWFAQHGQLGLGGEKFCREKAQRANRAWRWTLVTDDVRASAFGSGFQPVATANRGGREQAANLRDVSSSVFGPNSAR